MSNPYRDNPEQLQALIKEVSREFLHDTAFEHRYSGDSAYAGNHVVVSGGEPFDIELEERVKALMKDLTDG